ncbi:MAG TPA: helix-turn-helix domain-containing protein [Microbacteriaceae bacterium]|jgi:AcrR family transcriptional regulator|nr:helix-turn-helix domain-containing protein [Microbacteriaceae bacterium]
MEGRLVAATERLLAGGANFTELGIQRIVAEAKTARSTFYVHFRDKTELLLRLATVLREQSFALISQWQASEEGDSEDLAQLYEKVIALYREHGAVLAAVTEVAAYDPAVRAFWAAQLDRFFEATEKRLRRDQERGQLDSRLDPIAAAKIIVRGGTSVVTQHVAEDDGSGDAAVARELAHLQWYGAFRRPTE